jgi:hypothetical protein
MINERIGKHYRNRSSNFDHVDNRMERVIGSYSLIRSSAETVEGVNPVSVQFSAYDNGARWLVWGVLRDESITRVLVYDEEAAINFPTYTSFR